jgi:hypothetical protein
MALLGVLSVGSSTSAGCVGHSGAAYPPAQLWHVETHHLWEHIIVKSYVSVMETSFQT